MIFKVYNRSLSLLSGVPPLNKHELNFKLLYTKMYTYLQILVFMEALKVRFKFQSRFLHYNFLASIRTEMVDTKLRKFFAVYTHIGVCPECVPSIKHSPLLSFLPPSALTKATAHLTSLIQHTQGKKNKKKQATSKETKA